MRIRRAFSLVELLVVVTIIVILLLLLVPLLGRAMGTATIAQCGSNLSAIGKGFANYTTQNNGLMPQSLEFQLPNAVADPNIKQTPVDGTWYNSREAGWFYPPGINYYNMSWPEALYIDGAISTNPGNKGGRLKDTPGAESTEWPFPLCWENLFTCPDHSHLYQPSGDAQEDWGYGMAFLATSDFTSGLLVYSRNLNPVHIVATEAWVPLGSRSFLSTGLPNTALLNDPASDPVPAPNNGIGVYQRHQNGTKFGANYLMADSHVEFSATYGHYSSPAPGVAPAGAQLVSPTNIWVHP